MGANLKYYFSDVGLRNARLNFRQQEPTHIMENIVYNELLVRGYNVDVGIVDVMAKNVDSKRVRKQLEVDFVVNQGSQRYYIQVAYDMDTEEKQAQEEGTYHREMPFILGVPAKEMMENDKKLSEKDENEYVSVQGVIDAWIDGEDYITLIDFKTDKKPEDMTDEEFKELLKKRYQVQLSYYKRALMQMTKRPVKEACIYAVSIGQTIFC